MLSQDQGAPISSSGPDDFAGGPGGQLIDFVRRGHSFSGRERNCVYLNIGDGRFADVSGVSGIDFPDDARAVCRVDWDRDGDVDLWISNRNGPQLRLLRNDIRDVSDNLRLLLRGTESNRDAIGARVTLFGPEGKRVQTVHAGDGYLAQSSKWLVFANCRDATRLMVQWPNGQEEDFSLEPGARDEFIVIEGSGKLTRLQPPPRHAPSVQNDRPDRPTHATSSASISVVGLPVPPLPIEPLDSTSQPAQVHELDGPVLLTLWASWCAPCIEELNGWEQDIEEFKRAGINILAVSVDGLDDTRSNRADAVSVIQQLKLSFPAAFATREAIERLQLVHDYLFSLKQPLPIPASFLLDSEHRVLAIYKGPVSARRVLDDLKLQDATYAVKRSATTPFSGRWAGKPRTLTLGPFVLDLLGTGALMETSEYVQNHQNRFSPTQLLTLVVRLGIEHLKAGNQIVAERHFEMARKIEPRTVGPEIEKGKYFESLGDYGLARRSYEAAVQRNQNSLQAVNNLAWLLATAPDTSVRDEKRALQLALAAANATKHRHPGILDTLATCCANQERWDEAVTLAARAESVARGQKMFHLADAIANRKSLFLRRTKYRQEIVE